LDLIGVRRLKDGTSIVKLSNQNLPNKESFIAAVAHVSKPESVVYKNKRAQSTVDSDEEGSMQEVEMWHTHWQHPTYADIIPTVIINI